MNILMTLIANRFVNAMEEELIGFLPEIQYDIWNEIRTLGAALISYSEIKLNKPQN